jgi:hypothetical protein
MLAGFAKFDPAVEKKLAAHPDLPRFAVARGNRGRSSEKQRAVGDLVNIAFYWLLRVGEYTTKQQAVKGKRRSRKKKTRTRQFRHKDCSFFEINSRGDMIVLPPGAEAERILGADGATMWLSNQKNGKKGQSVSHHSFKDDVQGCPVRALARRYLHGRAHDGSGNALVCSYWDELGRGDVVDRDISFAVKFAAGMLEYPERGIPINRIDTHSLRAGGACAMKLSGHSEDEIIKQGRWAPKSTSFLEYIQQQLSTFSAGMAEKMSKIKKFTNMEGNGSTRRTKRQRMSVKR